MNDITPTEVVPHGLPSLASRFLDVAAMPWHEPFPGMRMKVLYKDDAAKEATMLFETQPGTVIPEHVHGGVEWAFVLEGTMEDAEGVCTAGNFVVRPAGSRHEVRTPHGAKYLAFFHGSARAVATGRLFPEYEEQVGNSPERLKP
jgi:anti-sigma factor ChrR (cupin superfamily)